MGSVQTLTFQSSYWKRGFVLSERSIEFKLGIIIIDIDKWFWQHLKKDTLLIVTCKNILVTLEMWQSTFESEFEALIYQV